MQNASFLGDLRSYSPYTQFVSCNRDLKGVIDVFRMNDTAPSQSVKYSSLNQYHRRQSRQNVQCSIFFFNKIIIINYSIIYYI
jgi:hypothetical protein